MINILPKKNDDIAFTRIVTEILASLLTQHEPQKVYVVQVNRRFDFKWIAFKGKFLGAVGEWNSERLRIPPFHPKKIVDESYFEKSGNRYVSMDAPRLHIPKPSHLAHESRIETLGDSAIFLWYSGETLIHPHASVMVYNIEKGEQLCWFVTFISKNTWRIKESRGISEPEARSLFQKASPETVS